jgi:dipeptide/tripeptide permease
LKIMQNKTNWLALVVAAAAGMGLGFLVYGVLFNDVWMAGNGITTNADQTQMFKHGKEVPLSSMPMIINAVALLIYAYLMNWLITKTGETTLAGGVRIGAVVGSIGLLLHYVSNRFAANPTSLSMVDGGYTLVLFIVIGAIVGGWRKK